MRRALDVAAAAGDDVPVGAVVLDEADAVIGRGHNRRELDHDPTAHAEVVALRAAGAALGTFDLSGCVLLASC